ncbi:LysR family transcriptional regulator [Virgibacillus profundi]|uniref:LysR family transcriptional regulator n=1 Tax=Virgibacillus profundi TaxID=2024555 RepID=A0A2A2I9A4_9BACI|nr:LysR family transcriptional regulator [Virgibacillus profundi]PAV28217.1 LysR family transcriptional regulator [Virgibacillus profundi]PXY52521.1 LysR family transcriptional regulator [Virgibacillus profundi]
MDVRVLCYFIALANERNISKAAESLHLTQPTLSRQLKELEEQLATTLFIRGNREIILTDSGHYLLQKAKEIIELVDRTEHNLSDSSVDIHGEIAIGCGETEGMRIIAKSLNKLQSTYPNIIFHLYSGNADDVSEKLENGLFDFGLLIEPTDKNQYDFIELPYQDRWGILMRRDSPLAHKDAIHPSDINDQPLLVSRQSIVDNQLSGWLGRNINQNPIVATYNLIFNAAIMVEEGLGYALCIDRLIDTSSKQTLKFLPFDPPLEANLNIVWKKNQTLSSASRAFLMGLRDDLSSYASN